MRAILSAFGGLLRSVPIEMSQMTYEYHVPVTGYTPTRFGEAIFRATHVRIDGMPVYELVEIRNHEVTDE